MTACARLVTLELATDSSLYSKKMYLERLLSYFTLPVLSYALKYSSRAFAIKQLYIAGNKTFSAGPRERERRGKKRKKKDREM